MDRHDPDNRPNSAPESRPRQEARSSGGSAPAAASSLMSVQIRRTRAPRKRAPCRPASSESIPSNTTGTPAPQAEAAKQALDPTTIPPAARAPQPTAASREPRHVGEITSYWTRLRGNRPYPAVSDLDPDLIGADWPNSILFRCRAGSGALMPDMSFLPRQDTGGGKIQLSPMMLQWLVSLAEDAVRNQRPVEDMESFPSAQRAIGYRAVALPLSDTGTEVDHVLCHVKQA
jgi:hypothetical protein